MVYDGGLPGFPQLHLDVEPGECPTNPFVQLLALQVGVADAEGADPRFGFEQPPGPFQEIARQIDGKPGADRFARQGDDVVGRACGGGHLRRQHRGSFSVGRRPLDHRPTTLQ